MDRASTRALSPARAIAAPPRESANATARERARFIRCSGGRGARSTTRVRGPDYDTSTTNDEPARTVSRALSGDGSARDRRPEHQSPSGGKRYTDGVASDGRRRPRGPGDAWLGGAGG